MSMKIIPVVFLAAILLLGVTASGLSTSTYAQNNNNNDIRIITPGVTNAKDIVPKIDLNTNDEKTLEDLLLECPAGLFVHKFYGDIVITCLIDSVYGKLFNSQGQSIDIDIKVENNDKKKKDDNNNKNKDRNNDKDKKEGPDRDCLFDPSLPKCASVDGECPDDFNQNGYEQCVPVGGCPDGYHTVEDDETGKCIPNSEGCPDGMELGSDGKSCNYIVEDNGNNMTNGNNNTGNGNGNGNNNGTENDNGQEIPLIDITEDPVIPPIDIIEEQTTTDETENNGDNANGGVNGNEEEPVEEVVVEEKEDNDDNEEEEENDNEQQ